VLRRDSSDALDAHAVCETYESSSLNRPRATDGNAVPDGAAVDDSIARVCHVECDERQGDDQYEDRGHHEYGPPSGGGWRLVRGRNPLDNRGRLPRHLGMLPKFRALCMHETSTPAFYGKVADRDLWQHALPSGYAIQLVPTSRSPGQASSGK
jgi:hypothetical protein